MVDDLCLHLVLLLMCVGWFSFRIVDHLFFAQTCCLLRGIVFSLGDPRIFAYSYYFVFRVMVDFLFALSVVADVF